MQAKVLNEFKQPNAFIGNYTKDDLINAINHYNQKFEKCIVEINDTHFDSGTSLNGKPYDLIDVSANLMDAVEDSTIASCDISTETNTNQRTVLSCTDAQGNNITESQFYAIEKQYMEKQEPAL